MTFISKWTRRMILTGVFVFLIFGATIPDSHSLGCGEKHAYFDTYEGSRLMNSTTAVVAVPTLPDCIYKCIDKKVLCLSINYQHDANQCYLNKRTRRTAPTENFKSDPGFTYYEKDPCILNPCLNGGTCSKENKTKEFECTCIPPRYIGTRCEIDLGPYGWSSKRPGKSCKDIAFNGDGVPYNGKYWIDPKKSGNPIPVYCEMSFEAGGWLLVSNIILPDPPTAPTLTFPQSYRNISNYNQNNTIISDIVLGQLRQVINFTRMRFHCRQASVGRTIHLVTTTDYKGTAVVNYLSGVTNTQPMSCGSFYQGPGDNSQVSGQCHLWDGNNKWSSANRINNWRVHDFLMWIPNLSYWMTTSSRLNCDSFGNIVNSPGDFWKIYVQ